MTLRDLPSAVVRGFRNALRPRIGLVGGGSHARVNLYPCLAGLPVQLAAVCTRHLDTAQAAADAFGARAAYSDLGAMLDKERLDAVIVCAGAKEHFGIAQAALEHGLHVFVEKPATATVREAEELMRIEERQDRFVMVGFQKRHAPAYRKARELAAAPSFGTVSSISATLCVGAVPGDRLLEEVAIHALDLLRYFCGDVVSVNVEQHRSPHGSATFALSLRFVSGAVGTALLSSARSWTGPNERVELTGEGEFLVVDNLVSLTRHRRPSGPAQSGPFDGEGADVWEPTFTPPTTRNHSARIEGFAGELECFVAAIREGGRPEAGLKDFVAGLRLVERIREAGGQRAGGSR